VIGGDHRRHIGITETRGARNLCRRAYKRRERCLVCVEAGEEFFEARRAHGPIFRPAANAARASSSCSRSRAIGG
jgi:hypothetical protein